MREAERQNEAATEYAQSFRRKKALEKRFENLLNLTLSVTKICKSVLFQHNGNGSKKKLQQLKQKLVMLYAEVELNKRIAALTETKC